MILRILLFPFSLLYGLVTFVRNKLYDWKWLSSVQFNDICVISVGNITVGGTGKTPHVEYLVRMLSPNYRIAVLSRGYKRKTKGFILATAQSTAANIGDEPCQIKQKFPHIAVAVDIDRIGGIHKLKNTFPELQVVLLDDAFQYRRIKPSLSILLADYNRPLYHDSMLPGGRLREWPCSARRAELMLVTKSPADISNTELDKITKRYTRIFPQKLYFTTVAYASPHPLFDNAELLPASSLKQYNILLVTGIAAPQPFENHIRSLSSSVQTITYPDHHPFTNNDIRDILHKWENVPQGNKLIITTEKDAVRLRKLEIPQMMVSHMYYMPIEVDFIGDGKSEVEQKVKEAINPGFKQ